MSMSILLQSSPYLHHAHMFLADGLFLIFIHTTLFFLQSVVLNKGHMDNSWLL